MGLSSSVWFYFWWLSIKKVCCWQSYCLLLWKGRTWCDAMIWMRTFSLSQSHFCYRNHKYNPVLSPAVSLSLPFLILQERGVHLSVKKDAWTQCKGASFQAGHKNPDLAECPCLAWVETSIWKREVNEERSAGKIGTLCGILQDGLLDKGSPLFDMPCANLCAPTFLNFPLDSIYQ